MRLVLISRTLGLLLLMFSISLIPPVAISFGFHDGESKDFIMTFLVTLVAGGLLWLPWRRHRHPLRSKDGFVIVAMFWVVMSVLSGLPLVFGVDHITLAGAVFEAVSAFTTTGGTVITGLDLLPSSILFYRQELQWLGGIGVIVSAVAILPMLGVGGMQLYRAETPGPMKDEKLTPRIAHTAQKLWIVYGALTLLCALGFWLAGMTPFDAVAHALSTVSTGGFSTHDASLAYFDSPMIEAIASLFMLLGAINFGVHFMALLKRTPRVYWRNTEVKVFLATVGILTLGVTITLYLTHAYGSIGAALRVAGFEVVSVITSTGFGIADFSLWPLFLPALLMLSSFFGGCAGSTAGGMKVIRFIILIKQGLLEILRLVHPSMVRPLKLEGRPIAPHVVEAVRSFFALYIAVFVILLVTLMADGMDQLTAFGAVATCLNNLGPGLGKVAANFAGVSEEGKWILSVAMLLGRLEIFTVLVLFSPAFWKE